MNAFPTLSRETIESPGFLDAFRQQIRPWSLGLYDPASGGFRRNDEIGPSVLSTTDVIWIRYAINEPEIGAPDRDAIVGYIQGKQNLETGKIPHDPGPAGQRHSDGHAFWQAIRALHLLGAEPLYFPHHLRPVLTPAGLDAWFAQFDWDAARDARRTGIPWENQPLAGEDALPDDSGRPVGNHHEVLGIVPAIASLGDPALVESFFRNIAKQQNEETGTWPRARTNISRTFAYTALHMSAGRLPNNPQGILDEVLRLQNEQGLWDEPLPGFHTMDSTYLLVRVPPRIGGYRQDECTYALHKVSRAMRRVWAENQATILDNTHQTLAIAHTLGLLQEAFPQEYPSARPYRFDWDKLELYRCEIIAQGRPGGGA